MLVTTPEWVGIVLGLLATLVRVVFALVHRPGLGRSRWGWRSAPTRAWRRSCSRWCRSPPRCRPRRCSRSSCCSCSPLPAGLDIAAVLLMLMGTQWYLLFNIIAGASAIPKDLKFTATLLHLTARERWRTLILPALFPYIVTGAITASGGAWNASIVAEYVHLRRAGAANHWHRRDHRTGHRRRATTRCCWPRP